MKKIHEYIHISYIFKADKAELKFISISLGKSPMINEYNFIRWVTGEYLGVTIFDK